MSDRLAESLALFHIRDDVVEHGVRGTDRQRRPTQPGQRKRLGIVVVAGFVLAQPGVKRDRHPAEFDLAQRRAANPHARIRLDGQAAGRGLDNEQCGLAAQLRADNKQLGVGGGRDQRLHAVEPVTGRGAHRGGLQPGGIE
ncbi:Uncharacterised protein [Mycobacterium tuberculosis]|uniref:Uncharacterized protein n=1 Tax=Mycobacterium tuberculosis TaxID=1773 RepID=A0A0T9DSY7_MYCTX|nr:Uncharacterised protein [Mycobacterium tuberculosis]CKS57775.1 Uncharacterised protein [Mycobacterium tuberculosis]COV80200.1 Uncharacterised protein [Mycobacterium tuberculosis]